MTTEETTVTEQTDTRRPLTAVQRRIVASLTDSDPSMVPKAVTYLPTKVFWSDTGKAKLEFMGAVTEGASDGECGIDGEARGLVGGAISGKAQATGDHALGQH